MKNQRWREKKTLKKSWCDNFVRRLFFSFELSWNVCKMNTTRRQRKVYLILISQLDSRLLELGCSVCAVWWTRKSFLLVWLMCELFRCEQGRNHRESKRNRVKTKHCLWAVNCEEGRRAEKSKIQDRNEKSGMKSQESFKFQHYTLESVRTRVGMVRFVQRKKKLLKLKTERDWNSIELREDEKFGTGWKITKKRKRILHTCLVIRAGCVEYFSL